MLDYKLPLPHTAPMKTLRRLLVPGKMDTPLVYAAKSSLFLPLFALVAVVCGLFVLLAIPAVPFTAYWAQRRVLRHAIKTPDKGPVTIPALIPGSYAATRAAMEARNLRDRGRWTGN